MPAGYTIRALNSGWAVYEMYETTTVKGITLLAWLGCEADAENLVRRLHGETDEESVVHGGKGNWGRPRVRHKAGKEFDWKMPARSKRGI